MLERTGSGVREVLNMQEKRSLHAVRIAWRRAAAILPLLLLGAAGLTAQDASAPITLRFAAKTGDVLYLHYAHAKRESNRCGACHPALFSQTPRAPLNYRDHAKAEAAKASCGACHREGGKAFSGSGACSGICHAERTAK
jgi:c(7)-type cytochrome triheme protein